MLVTESKRTCEKDTVLLESVRSGTWLNMEGKGESSNVLSQGTRGPLNTKTFCTWGPKERE